MSGGDPWLARWFCEVLVRYSCWRGFFVSGTKKWLGMTKWKEDVKRGLKNDWRFKTPVLKLKQDKRDKKVYVQFFFRKRRWMWCWIYESRWEKRGWIIAIIQTSKPSHLSGPFSRIQRPSGRKLLILLGEQQALTVCRSSEVSSHKIAQGNLPCSSRLCSHHRTACLVIPNLKDS